MQSLFYSDRDVVKTICNQHKQKNLHEDLSNYKRFLCALIDDYEKLQKKGKVPSQIDCKQLRHLLGNTNPIEFDFVMDMHDNLDLYLDYDLNIESIVLNDKTLVASLDMFDKITCDNIRTMFKMIQSGFVSDVERKTIEFLIDYKTAEGNIQ